MLNTMLAILHSACLQCLRSCCHLNRQYPPLVSGLGVGCILTVSLLSHAAALADDDFADFASAAPEPPVSPATAPQDQPLSEDAFAATSPAAEHGPNGGSLGGGEQPSDAYAVVSTAAEARENGSGSAAAGDDLLNVGQPNSSVQSAAMVIAEPLVLATTAAQAEAEDVFAAFSPKNAAKAGTEVDDWSAEEGFGAFATVTVDDDIAAQPAAAGVTVSSPKRVTRDWCVCCYVTRDSLCLRQRICVFCFPIDTNLMRH